ncbi:hypothetical protein CTP10_R80040 (plasmid) [Cupriavidus sp. P-10]|uniref:hypothetical protein n=1 Tax=unclassified Cupriavidus TaxID=2640874 RepID=UPI0011C16382|nr:hypothetical protein [Cupriavidus sp. P-10]BDB30587.1 hypothetical protein CTP10_R80040 [Cupriavidus sp. P-10]
MSIEKYRGYIAEGFANPRENGKFEAVGRVSLDFQTIREADVLGYHETSDGAQLQGILWARYVIDTLHATNAASARG